jgi:hypothetical protein
MVGGSMVLWLNGLAICEGLRGEDEDCWDELVLRLL